MLGMQPPAENEARQMYFRFQRSATDHARRALANVTNDDERRVLGAVDAGVAVEHMAKAYLTAIHPTLLTERGADFDTLLHLSGHGVLAKSKKHAIRTVSAHEACQRVARVLPEFKYVEKVDQAIFVVRNSGVHLAFATEESAHESARIMVRLLEPLIVGLELDRATFWGDMLSAADTLLDETINEILAILEVKYSAARSRLKSRLEGLAADQRKIVLTAIAGRPSWLSDHDEPWECPVCGEQGTLGCGIEDVGQPEFDYEQVDIDEFIYHGGHIDRTAYASSFECSACGLELNDRELVYADLPTEFDLEPRDCEPWEFEDRPD